MMKGVTVNVSFSRQLLKMMDALARKEAVSRSEFLREAVRWYVEQKRRWDKLFGFWQEEAKRAGLKPQDVESLVAEVRQQRKAAA